MILSVEVGQRVLVGKLPTRTDRGASPVTRALPGPRSLPSWPFPQCFTIGTLVPVLHHPGYPPVYTTPGTPVRTPSSVMHSGYRRHAATPIQAVTGTNGIMGFTERVLTVQWGLELLLITVINGIKVIINRQALNHPLNRIK